MTERPSVAILGAGVGGIAMGIALKRSGYPFTMYEQSDGVGGTWRHNSYPGAACDVPSHFYSYSFELNPWWSRTYATQPEILAYLERCTDRYGIRPHLRTNTTISEARWDERDRTWSLTAESGETFEAAVSVSGLGMLNVPNLPDIPGSERFRGRIFHSSRWDHGKPLAGERVASIGTGASAVQYVPAIAPEVEHLTVFQRSPIWITPRLDKPFTDTEQRRFARVPFAARVHRFGIWRTYQRASFRADSEQTTQMTELARSYLARKVADPALRAALTPEYPVGCKRPLMSRVVPDASSSQCAVGHRTDRGDHRTRAVRTADGEIHEVDTIIYGTGFKANQFLSTIEIVGLGGRRLRDVWADGAEAYLGLSVPGFPNFFMLYGPNTNGVTSIVFMIEAQVHFIMRAAPVHASHAPYGGRRPARSDGAVQPEGASGDARHGVDGGMFQLLSDFVRQGRDPTSRQWCLVLVTDPVVPGLALPSPSAACLTSPARSAFSARTVGLEEGQLTILQSWSRTPSGASPHELEHDSCRDRRRIGYRRRRRGTDADLGRRGGGVGSGGHRGPGV